MTPAAPLVAVKELVETNQNLRPGTAISYIDDKNLCGSTATVTAQLLIDKKGSVIEIEILKKQTPR